MNKHECKMRMKLMNIFIYDKW